VDEPNGKFTYQMTRLRRAAAVTASQNLAALRERAQKHLGCRVQLEAKHQLGIKQHATVFVELAHDANQSLSIEAT
jgi:hypothetical protein